MEVESDQKTSSNETSENKMKGEMRKTVNGERDVKIQWWIGPGEKYATW